MGSGRGKTRRTKAAVDPRTLDPRREALANKDWGHYLALHGHEEVLEAFVTLQDQLEGKEYWELLRDVWIRAEQIQPRDVWAQLLTQHEGARTAIMTEEERAHLASLPEQITVYRGVGNPEHQQGFSWTLDRQRAEWFAQRFLDQPIAAMFRLTSFDPNHKAEPVLVTGVVSRKDVIAYLAQRDEQELVVLPEKVKVESARKLKLL